MMKFRVCPEPTQSAGPWQSVQSPGPLQEYWSLTVSAPPNPNTCKSAGPWQYCPWTPTGVLALDCQHSPLNNFHFVRMVIFHLDLQNVRPCCFCLWDGQPEKSKGRRFLIGSCFYFHIYSAVWTYSLPCLECHGSFLAKCLTSHLPCLMPRPPCDFLWSQTFCAAPISYGARFLECVFPNKLTCF